MSLVLSAAMAAIAPTLIGQTPPLPSPAPLESAFPQTAPLIGTVRWAYAFVRLPDEPGSGRQGLVPVTINGLEGVLPPKSRTIDGAWIRSAYWLKVWSVKLRQNGWSQTADKMMNMVVASGIVEGPAKILPDGVTTGDVDLLQGAGWAARYAAEFPDYPQAAALAKQTEAWASTRASNRQKITPNELGSLAQMAKLAKEGSPIQAAFKQRISGNLAWLENDARTAGDQLAAIDAINHSLALAAPENKANLIQLRDRLVDKVLAVQSTENDLRAAPIPTKGLLALAGDRPAWEAWYLPALLTATSQQSSPANFRKAVQMLRTSHGLYSMASGEQNGLWQDGLAMGRYAATPWMLARQGADAWPGFTHGEGQFMGSILDIIQTFGSIYTSEKGWTEPVDALTLTEKGPITLLKQMRIPYEGIYDIDLVTPAGRTRLEGEPAAPIGVKPPVLTYDAQGIKIVAAPTFLQIPGRPLNPKGSFVLPGGIVKPAVIGPEGFELPLEKGMKLAGEVEFRGTAGGTRFTATSNLSLAAPNRQADWTLMGGPGWVGAEKLAGIAATGDENQRELRGQAVSRPFASGRLTLGFRLEEGTKIYIEDAVTGRSLRSLQSLVRSNQRVVLDLDSAKNPVIRIRISDESKKGFAAIYSISVS